MFNIPLLNTLDRMKNDQGEKMLDVIINRLYEEDQLLIREIAAVVGISVITVSARLKTKKGREGISEDKEAVLALKERGESPKEIAYTTGFSIHKVYRILRENL